jgi:hypothetical protein
MYYPTMMWFLLLTPSIAVSFFTGDLPEEAQNEYGAAAVGVGFILIVVFIICSIYIRRRNGRSDKYNEWSSKTSGSGQGPGQGGRFVDPNINLLYEELLQRHYRLRSKITVGSDWMTIRFHQHMEIRLNSNICTFLNESWYFYDSRGALAFIDELVNEEVVFFQNSRTGRLETYPGRDLKDLIAKKNKRNCRVFSAKMIYVDK